MCVDKLIFYFFKAVYLYKKKIEIILFGDVRV